MQRCMLQLNGSDIHEYQSARLRNRVADFFKSRIP
jgi:hypothetical protein